VFFPKLKTLRQTRVTLNGFLGLDRREKAPQGSFYDMENMGSDAAPALQVRPRRGTVAQLQKGNGLACKDALVWVDGHTLYVGGAATGLVLSDSPKQLVSMGAYLVIFPDKKWVNTRQLSQFGSLENRTVTTGAVSFSMCSPSGESIGSYLTAQQPPEAAQAGALWMDTSADKAVLRRYGEEGWTAVEDTCVKIAAAGIGVGFAAGDGVTLSGCGAAGLDGDAVLVAVERDALVVAGIVENDMTQDTAVTVARSVPDMDYVVECGNRLWGCKYGMVDGKPVNEIYACKLGDFRNWYNYMGLSTDSYAVTVGTDGVFTGAATLKGTPLFFKESCIHRVTGYTPSSFTMTTTMCRGVQEGSSESLAVVGEALLYKGRTDVMLYDGSIPVAISNALGDTRYHSASAGANADRYYISMQEHDGPWRLFVYDVQKGLWHLEDNTHAVHFAQLDDEWYFNNADTGDLVAENGYDGMLEDAVEWSATFGKYGFDYEGSKYLSRYNLRMALEPGSKVKMEIQYDSDGKWHTMGTMTGKSLRTFMIPVIPRRCDHCQLRLSGTGRMKLYSLARVLELGGDG
jgi:hypothetical protein